MSLTSGRRLSRAQWTELPMPDSVILAVEQRAKAEKQPLIVGGCPLFEWRPDRPIQASDEDGDITTADGNGSNHGEYNTDPNVWAPGATIADVQMQQARGKLMKVPAWSRKPGLQERTSRHKTR
jgi:hypothetical protein